MTPYAAAEALADMAVPSFPLAANKAPLTPRGFHDATLAHDPAVWAWAALVGVPTGDAGGFDVLDIDMNGGMEWLAANAHRLPATRTVHTRSGGRHLYFKARADIRCSAGKIAPAVDVRGDGGFVVAWDLAGLPVEHADRLAEWPEWLLDAARGPRVRHADNPARSAADLAPPSAEVVVALLDRMPNPDDATRDDYLKVMLAAKGCIDGLDDDDGADDIAEAAIGWADRWSGSPGADVEREKWESDFSLRDAPLAGWPNLLAMAHRFGVDTTPERAAIADAEFKSVPLPAIACNVVQPGRRLRMVDRLLHPADCATGPRRGYVIKRLLAPGDVGAVIGAPGCGKSQIAPLLAYAVAQGREVFGCRTKQGATLYVAAEDFAGMRQRVHALRLAHGDAPDFALVDCGNLADESESADLLNTVDDLRPALVIIDTVGAAWAGMDENDAAGMGAVVALARRIAATGAAVILVHHTAKNGDGTPRGHSVLNGTLDMCLALGTLDEHRIIRGKLNKNRNGPCDLDIAVRSDAVALGTDEDGDAITAPIATPLAGNEAPRRPKLSPREQRAFDILISSDTGAGVTEETWHAACEEQRLVASDNPANRRKVAAQIMRTLLDKRAISAAGGLFRAALKIAAEQPRTAGNRLEQEGTELEAVHLE